MKTSKAVLLLGLAWTLALPLHGVETTFWQVGTYEDLLQGTLQGVSLTKAGELKLAPETQAVFNPEETLGLSIARDRHHNIYFGTGHEGKVFRLDAKLKGSLFFTAQEPEIFALAAGPDDALYVGSSPEGKIYRVTPDGKSTVFCNPKAKYIWALVFDSQGRLYAGTGDRGLILRIDKNGKAEAFFDSKQTHIMCLAADARGNLLAGSVPNGLIYRIAPEGKGFVLYQSSLSEVHDLAVDARGRIFAAVLGGAGARGTPELFAPPATAVPGATTTITVQAASEGNEEDSAKAQRPPANSAATPSFNRSTPAAPGFPLPPVAPGRGALVEIRPDYTAEPVWTSNKENIFGLVIRDNHVLFSTDSSGRVFDLDLSSDGGDLTLLAETHEAQAMRLLLQGQDVYVATSNIAKLIRLASTPGHEGSYESPVKDAKFISRWGVLAWRGEVPAGAKVEFFSRSGNTDRPDQTWTDWAGPYTDPQGSQVESTPARYFQWKAVFRGSDSASPVLDDVTVSYLNQNVAPEIRSLNVSTGGERSGPTGTTPSPNITPGASITMTAGSSSTFGASSPGAGMGAKTPVTLSWQADDPNGDQLVYSLYVKAEDEREWHRLKDELHQTSFTLEANSLPDGNYVARLVASDEESNPPAVARKTELVSAPFWIDNTPPAVRVLKQAVTGRSAEVQFQAEDAMSPLRAAETAADEKDWKAVNSDDGIVDSRTETFTVRLENLEPGEHIIALRAYDTAGNAGLGKAVIRVAGPGKNASER